MLVGSDIGGTFTDVIGLTDAGQVAIRKVPSTPRDFSEALLSGSLAISRDLQIAPTEIGQMRHACTVATNAILEGKGSSLALVTTAGFRDVLELRRIRVPRLYDPLYEKPAPLVPRRLRFEAAERLAHDGSVLVALDDTEIERLLAQIAESGVEAVAVCFLHSYANARHERLLGAAIADRFPDLYLSLSVDVLPEMREYERASTTVVNSYVGPVVSRYLDATTARLASLGIVSSFELMQSSGGTAPIEEVRRLPAQIIECGPAAGVVGARNLGLMLGEANLIAFDMGGTTAKASLIEDGHFFVSDTFEVGSDLSSVSAMAGGAGYAVKLPVIDIAEVGAGGGSLVSIDPAGGVVVGPKSAGADPGPACYRRGNTKPTVTDANVALGFVDPTIFAGGQVQIDRELAEQAIRETVCASTGSTVDEAAHGIRRIANAHMARAIKSVSTYKGRDPRDFKMIAYGGNGGLHGPDLAAQLGMTHVVVPPAAGVFSALGLLCADIEVTASVPFNVAIGGVVWPDVARAIADAARRNASRLREPAKVRLGVSLLMRYAGQAFELAVPVELEEFERSDVEKRVRAAFEEVYVRTYGYRGGADLRVELVSARLRLTQMAARSIGDILTGLGTGDVRRSNRRCYFGPEFGHVDTPVLSRAAVPSEPMAGPVIVAEGDCTTVVPPEACLWRDAHHNLRIELSTEVAA